MKSFKEIREGTIKVNDWSTDGGGQDPKKLGIKVKKKSSSPFGGDNVEMSAPDNKLIKYAIANLGVSKKARTLRDVQKELDNQ